MQKILVIRFSSIGDIVLTTPVVRCLKKQLPDAEVHFVTKAAFAPIMEANPYVHKVHKHGDDLKATIALLQAEQFDFIVDLHHNLRTLRVKKALKAPSQAYDKLNIEKWLLTALKINRMPAVHIVDRYLDAAKSVHVQNDGAGLDYFIPEDEVVQAEQLPPTHRHGYIGLVAGAALATKQLPVEKMLELCSQVAAPIMILGGKEDIATGEALAKAFPEKIWNACGKFSLHQSASLVQQATVIITHDTGLMHIAAAFKKPILSIWGNTVPAFGMGPFYGSMPQEMQASFEVSGLSCRPCSKIGYAKCPKGHFKCMQLQDTSAIAMEANRLFARLTSTT